MTVSVVPSVASVLSNAVLADVTDIKQLLSICDLKGKILGAASCVHYQDGYLFSTDGYRMMFFKVNPALGGNLPLERFAIYGTEIAAAIKGSRGLIELDLGSFTSRAKCIVDGMAFLRNYVPTFVSSIDAVRIRDMMQSDEIFGPNVAWQFIGEHLLLSTGSNFFYTIAAKHRLEIDYFGTTPIVGFQSAFFEGIPAWSKMSTPSEKHPQIFSMPIPNSESQSIPIRDRMYYVVMPAGLNPRPTIDIAFKYAIDID